MSILHVVFCIALQAAFSQLSVRGTWDFDIQWLNGDRRTAVFVLQQDGEKLTGTYTGGLGSSKVSGTLKESFFELRFQTREGPFRVWGTMQASESKLRGQIDFPRGKGIFTANKRSVPK
jgi:hypothetical protein